MYNYYYYQVRFHSFVIKRSLRIIKAIPPLFTNMEWVWRCPSSWGSLRSASYQHLFYRCTTWIAPCGSKNRNKHIDWTRYDWSRWFLPPTSSEDVGENKRRRRSRGGVRHSGCDFRKCDCATSGKKKRRELMRKRALSFSWNLSPRSSFSTSAGERQLLLLSAFGHEWNETVRMCKANRPIIW